MVIENATASEIAAYNFPKNGIDAAFSINVSNEVIVYLFKDDKYCKRPIQSDVEVRIIKFDIIFTISLAF